MSTFGHQIVVDVQLMPTHTRLAKHVDSKHLLHIYVIFSLAPSLECYVHLIANGWLAAIVFAEWKLRNKNYKLIEYSTQMLKQVKKNQCAH